MADTSQLIQNFYQVAQKREFARDFSFRLLSISSGGASTVTFDETDLVYIKSATLPGRDITNVKVPYMGLEFNIPGSVKYPGSDNYELKFFCDQNSQLRQKFENWSRDIFDDATSTGNYFTPRQNSVIDMIQLDPQLNKVAQYQLIGVAINKVGPLQYNISEGVGNTVEFTANITYHYWTKK